MSEQGNNCPTLRIEFHSNRISHESAQSEASEHELFVLVPKGAKEAHINITDCYQSVVIGSFNNRRTKDLVVSVSAINPIQRLELTTCSVVFDLRNVEIDLLVARSLNETAVSLLGKVEDMDVGNISLGNYNLPVGLRKLKCENLPIRIPDGLESLDYMFGDTKNPPVIPESVKTIISPYMALDNFPNDLRNLTISARDPMLARLCEKCPNLETLTVIALSSADADVEILPKWLLSLEIASRAPSVRVFKKNDFSSFANMQVFKTRDCDFIHPPNIRKLSIDNSLSGDWTNEKFVEDFFNRIKNVEILELRYLTKELFEKLKSSNIDKLFLSEYFDQCDMSDLPFPVIITSPHVICSTGHFSSRNIMTVVDVCNDGRKFIVGEKEKEFVSYSCHDKHYEVIGRDTIEGIDGDVDVLYLKDEGQYFDESKSARKKAPSAK